MLNGEYALPNDSTGRFPVVNSEQSGPWILCQRWALFIGIWTLIGLSFASQFYFSSSALGRPVSWRFAMNYSLWDWYVFGLLSLPVIVLARRFRLERGIWARSLAVHFFASILFSFAYMVVRSLVAQLQGWWSGQPVNFQEAFQPLLVKTFFIFLVYWVIASIWHAFAFYREAQEKEVRAIELERRLAQARLQALQMQLNPHFLFNTLHAISSLMHKDVEAADRMITRLSDLLRYALESTDAQEVPLKQELDFLEGYLEIEQTRFGARLQVRQEIDPSTLDARVPNLVLQPLVENAIRHGIEPHAKMGQIELRAVRDDQMLRLEVLDNGGGLSGAAEEGVGLSNTRSRLEHLYGDAQRLELQNRAEGGLAVTVVIPFRQTNEHSSFDRG